VRGAPLTDAPAPITAQQRKKSGIDAKPRQLTRGMTEIDKDKLASDTEALDDFNRGIVEEFRANDGKVSGVPGGTLLLLHTTGAKSGNPRLSPPCPPTRSGAPAWLKRCKGLPPTADRSKSGPHPEAGNPPRNPGSRSWSGSQTALPAQNAAECNRGPPLADAGNLAAQKSAAAQCSWC
jgi:hypothetical protein